MENKQLIERVINQLKGLSLEAKEVIIEQLKAQSLNEFNEEVITTTITENKQVNDKFECSHCKGYRTSKAGKTNNNKQRYKCLDCDKHMIATRDTITFSSKKDFSQWVIALECLLAGDSIEVMAYKADISTRTAFRWRHKLLYALNQMMNKAVLEGTITLDETHFPVVSKRVVKEKQSSEKTKKRGVSDQKINVSCAIDEHSNTIMKVSETGRVTSKSLIDIYDNKIKKGSKVISDSHRSYHGLMSHLEIEWIKIPSKKKSLNGHTLDKVNNLHSYLKDFTYKYKGISVKYLQGYVALFEFVRNNKNWYQKDNLMSLIKAVFTTIGHIKCSLLDSTAQIYA